MKPTRGSLTVSLVLVVSTAFTAVPAAAAPGGPPNCWVSWRPSEGSISFANTGKNDTDMTFKLKWRGEDLTFRTCRYHTAFELETFFGTSNNRHKLGGFKILSTDLPRAYIDVAREPGEVTFGIANADALVADKWYTLTYRFKGRLGPDEFLDVDASRGYLKSYCPLGDAKCVFGWTEEEVYGPSARIGIFDNRVVSQGATLTWWYPDRSTLRNKILRHPVGTDAYVLDSSYVRHWIPDGGTYLCLVNQGMQVVNDFANLDQRWVINSFTQGPNATCTPPPDGGGGGTGGGGSGGPSVTASKGGSAQGRPGCSSVYCAYLVVTLNNFAAGSHTITCNASNTGEWYRYTTSATQTAYCYYGYPGQTVWATADGIRSNNISW